MPLNALRSVKGIHKRKKLVGRGSGSGHGKTSTRGHKGQRSRSGRDFYPGFEGGQSPLIRRVPKRGFSHLPQKEYQIVNLNNLNVFPEGSTVNPELLEKKGLIKNKNVAVKILGDGEFKAALVVCAHKFSKSALEKIRKAGGKAEIISTVVKAADKTNK